MKVAVIGAGISGLAVLRHNPKSDKIKLVCFEKNAHFGGTWKYSEPLSSSESISKTTYRTSSIYQNLITNIPALLMRYPDFLRMDDQSYIHHSEVMKYITEYCETFDLTKFIRFSCPVQSLKRISDESGKSSWQIIYNNEKGVSETSVFDYVFACVGHFSYPRFMSIQGLDAFPGKVLHSQDYDDPVDFAGQKVLLVGRGNSSIDICVELMTLSDKVVVSSNNPGKTFEQYDNVQEVELITEFKDGLFYCQDSPLAETFDTVMFCTGYTYDMPFVDVESCELQIEDGIITPLYKFTVHAKCPSLFIIGLNQRVCPFPTSYYQAAYCWSIITGPTKLPDNLLEITNFEICERLKKKKRRHFFCITGDEEWPLMNEFAEIAGLEGPRTWFPELRKILSKTRTSDPVNYKYYTVKLTDDASKVQIMDSSGKLLYEVEEFFSANY